MCLLGLPQQRIGRSGLDADVQRDQRVVHPLAYRQQFLAAADDLGAGSLGQVHLIFNHLYHGSARRKEIDGGELVLRKDLRDLVCLPPQRVVIGAGGVPDVDPCRVMVPQQHRVSLLKAVRRLHVRAEREAPCQKIAAERHVLLPVVLDLGVGALQFNVRVGEASLQERRLRPHDLFRALPMVPGDPIVMGHALVHLGKLARKLPWGPVEHHQDGR